MDLKPFTLSFVRTKEGKSGGVLALLSLLKPVLEKIELIEKSYKIIEEHAPMIAAVLSSPLFIPVTLIAAFALMYRSHSGYRSKAERLEALESDYKAVLAWKTSLSGDVLDAMINSTESTCRALGKVPTDILKMIGSGRESDKA